MQVVGDYKFQVTVRNQFCPVPYPTACPTTFQPISGSKTKYVTIQVRNSDVPNIYLEGIIKNL